MRVCGLMPLNSSARRKQEMAICAADPFPPNFAWAAEGAMPVWRWNDEFERTLADEAARYKSYLDKKIPIRPWEVLRGLKPEAISGDAVLAWNQGYLPSCSCHAAAHALQASQLVEIARGAPMIYSALNPIYSFWRARNGNMAGGLDMISLADEINTVGMYPVESVGTDNTRVDEEAVAIFERDAAAHQAGIVRIESESPSELTEKIFDACRAGCSVCFGAGIFFSSADVDRNGVRVMDTYSRERGGHAQAFAGWMDVSGTQYVFNWNSHGDRYSVKLSQSGQLDGDSPASGAWCDMETVSLYARSMPVYGAPMVLFAEGRVNRSLNPMKG